MAVAAAGKIETSPHSSFTGSHGIGVDRFCSEKTRFQSEVLILSPFVDRLPHKAAEYTSYGGPLPAAEIHTGLFTNKEAVGIPSRGSMPSHPINIADALTGGRESSNESSSPHAF